MVGRKEPPATQALTLACLRHRRTPQCIGDKAATLMTSIAMANEEDGKRRPKKMASET
jgi:hypothetical protein